MATQYEVINVALPPKMVEELNAIARQDGMRSRSSVVREFLSDRIEAWKGLVPRPFAMSPHYDLQDPAQLTIPVEQG